MSGPEAMSGTTPQPPDDAALQAFLAGQGPERAAWQQATALQGPPKALDALILRTAAAPIRKATRFNRYRMPMALAATLVLGSSLLLNLRESPEWQEHEAARQMPVPAASVPQPAAPPAETLAAAAEAPAPVPAPTAPAAAASAPAADSAVVAAAKPAARPAAAPPPAPAPPVAVAKGKAEAASESFFTDDSVLAQAPVAAPAPAAPAAAAKRKAAADLKPQATALAAAPPPPPPPAPAEPADAVVSAPAPAMARAKASSPVGAAGLRAEAVEREAAPAIPAPEATLRQFLAAEASGAGLGPQSWPELQAFMVQPAPFAPPASVQVCQSQPAGAQSAEGEEAVMRVRYRCTGSLRLSAEGLRFTPASSERQERYRLRYNGSEWKLEGMASTPSASPAGIDRWLGRLARVGRISEARRAELVEEIK